MSLSAWSLIGAMLLPSQAPQQVVPTNQAEIKLPINYVPGKESALREMILYVSPDLGRTWHQYAVAKPQTDKFFPFRAGADGEYWFTMVQVSTRGDRLPRDVYAAAPDLKLLIDTKKPVVAIQNAERKGNSITVGWKIVEKNPDWSRFRMEYSNDGATWQALQVRPELEGTTMFNVNSGAAVSVRITCMDVSGNSGSSSQELPAAAVVSATTPADLVRTSTTGPELSPLPPPPGTGTGKEEVTPPLLVGNTPKKGKDGNDTRPDPTFADAPKLPATGPAPTEKPKEPQDMLIPGSADPVGISSRFQAANLPQIQHINTTSFKLAYDVENKGTSGIGKAEIYVTRDDGKTWTKWDEIVKPESPLIIDLRKNENKQVEGTYGLKVILHSGAGLAQAPPKDGDAPDLRIEVDVTLPIVKIYKPDAHQADQNTLILRWEASDKHLTSEPMTLEWAESPNGPWIPIVPGENIGVGTTSARRVANTGQYAWKIPSDFPAHKVFLKMAARDLAGNIAEAITREPIVVDLSKPSAIRLNIIGSGK
ncbi:MAG: hypothetical protein R3B84_10310 [Zavarzinella sp.]